MQEVCAIECSAFVYFTYFVIKTENQNILCFLGNLNPLKNVLVLPSGRSSLLRLDIHMALTAEPESQQQQIHYEKKMFKHFLWAISSLFTI